MSNTEPFWRRPVVRIDQPAPAIAAGTAPATVTVDETAPADDTEGDFRSSPPAGLATASVDTNIFNERGLLRDDLDQINVAPERRPLLDTLVAATKAENAAEAMVKVKDAAVVDAVKARDLAAAAYPRSTFLDEWKRMAGKTVEAPPPGAPEAIRGATAAWELASQELRVARDNRAKAREMTAQALAAYNQAVPVMTPLENQRAFIAASNADRAARNGKPHRRPYTGGPSMVDHMAAAMKGGSGPGARAGGGASYKRGGVSLAEASRLNSLRIRQERASAETNANFNKGKPRQAP